MTNVLGIHPGTAIACAGPVCALNLATFERVADVEVGLQAAGIAFWKLEMR